MNSKNELINNILNNSIEGIILIENGFIVDINNSLMEILMYEDKAELIGNLATGILIPNINTKYIEYDHKTYQEINILTKTGVTIPVMIKIVDIDKNSKIVYILNLSELKEKEKLLISKSKHSAMGEMISMISHQWKQPLNTLSSIAARMTFRNRTNKLTKNSIEEDLKDISSQINYMSETIDDFRNFFSKDKNKEHINLYEISEIVLKMIYSNLESNNIKVDLISEDNLSKLYIYKNDFIQVLLNILNNSVDAFIEKEIVNKEISIYFKEENSTQTIYIQDNAGGISEDIIGTIFDPYFSTKSHKNGTGLGLYICKTIIEKKLNGQIFVSNNKNGILTKIEVKA